MFLLSMRFLASGFCDWQQLCQAVADPPMGNFWGAKFSQGYGCRLHGVARESVRDVNQSRSNLPCGLYSGIALSVGGYESMLCQPKPVDAVQALMSLAQKLVVAGAEKVIICQLLYRASLIFRGSTWLNTTQGLTRATILLGGGEFLCSRNLFLEAPIWVPIAWQLTASTL
jgi:hypothetical protein